MLMSGLNEDQREVRTNEVVTDKIKGRRRASRYVAAQEHNRCLIAVDAKLGLVGGKQMSNSTLQTSA